MTNKKDYAPITYNCNGATVDFPFTWKILNGESIVLTLVDATEVETVLTLGTDYTVDYDDVGGTVTTKTVYETGNKIIVARNASLYQEKTFSTSSGFQASEIEKAFDGASINLQDMQYNIETFESKVNIEVDEIQDEVNTANEKADTAITTANGAVETANGATTTANNATTTANNASTNASNAVTTANNATSTANTAKTTADSASTLANNLNERVDEFEEEIEEVKEAAKKINQLEQAVATAVAKANEAVQSASEAQTSAKTATEKAKEISESAEQIQTNKENIETNTSDIETNKTNIGTLDDLTTTEKSSLVGAVNEVNSLKAVKTEVESALAKKANIIWYANRDFEYSQPDFIKADKANVTIKGGTAIGISGQYYYTQEDVTYLISDILDSGSVTNGKDYNFYLDTDKNIKATLSETIPDGCVLIGGAHTLCVGVTSSTAPTLLSDSFWSSHPAIGYNAGHFIPNSSWTPAYKSGAKTGNKGQVLIERYGIEKHWVDIYLQSGTGTATASSYSGTITNSRQPILHQWDMNCVGKKLPTDQQFTIFAEGSNNCTNISDSAIPSGKLTGGYSDTAGKRMISGFFVECCCGYLWQWGDEIAPAGGSGWSAYGVTTRGASYGMPYVLNFGGKYSDSTHCGSWARNCSITRASVYAYAGARGVSLHIEKQHS